MKIREIIEKTYVMRLDVLSLDLPVGQKKVREILKSIDCQPNGSGKKGWSYVGADQSILEKDFTEFIKATATPKRTNERINKKSETQIKEPTKSTKNDIIDSDKPLKTEVNEPPKEVITQPSNVVRKRTSFDLDTQLLKQLKIKAVMEEKNLYELVEQAIKEFLKK